MITKKQAQDLPYRKQLEHVSQKNADGTPVRCRVNGQVKTWKTRPEHFRLPVKYGLKTYFYITQDNCSDWVEA